MPSLKISVLALATAVAAVPNYGHANAHSKYHNSNVAHGKPYPTGGWAGAFNSTRVPQATGGDGGYGGDKTIDVTTTTTTTIRKTVTVKPSSPAASVSSVKVADNEGGQGGQCGPATVTVTAHEAVTVTVTPGSGAGVPASSVVAVESKSKGEGYPVNSTPKGETKPTPPPAAPSSKAEKPTPPPVVPSSKAPEVPVPSSKAEEPKPSSVQKPSEASSAPAPSKTPSTGGSYTGSKRGLAYNDASLCKNFGGKFGFAYNWGQVENNDVGTQYIPMMHRPSESTPESWLSNVKKACDKGTKAVMGFNEPDHAEQANMSPEAACSAWKQYMNPIASSHPDVTIIGPSVTNAGGPEASNPSMGLGWLQKFHDVCPDAIVHATNIHFYDIYEEATIDRFKAQVEKAAQIYGKPVWITEFGLNPGSASPAQALNFLKEAMAYLDGSDKVQGYSWFMVGSGENQLNSGNGLSALGEAYAAY